MSALVLALALGAPALAAQAADPEGETGSGRPPRVSRLDAGGRDRSPPSERDPTPAPPAALEGGRRGARTVVVVLHGGSFRPREPDELARRARDALDADAKRLGLRLLVPVAPAELLAASRTAGLGSPWASAAGRELVLALLDAERAHRRLDPRRVHLAAHGAGVAAAVHLAAAHPRRFAGLALWSGTPEPLWERTEDGGRRLVGLAGDPVPRLSGVPVYLWTGDEDELLDRAVLERFVTGMRAAAREDGGRTRLRRAHGPGGHDHGPGPREGLRFLKSLPRARRERPRRRPVHRSVRARGRDPPGRQPPRVMTSRPSAVTSIVCSNWATRLAVSPSTRGG